MEWMLKPFHQYADFKGRARRKEYWLFTLFIIIVSLVLSFIDHTAGFTLGSNTGVLGFIFYLAIFVPSLAVGVRRLHDIDKSGWFILLGFIPLIGAIALIILMCLPGTQGDNRFGPDPLAEDETETAAA